MGKKIPYDTAMKMGGISDNPSIFNNQNLYGYKININNKTIRPLYERYKEHVGCPSQIGLSHEQRLHFEAIILRMIQKKRGETYVQSSDPDGPTGSGS